MYASTALSLSSAHHSSFHNSHACLVHVKSMHRQLSSYRYRMAVHLTSVCYQGLGRMNFCIWRYRIYIICVCSFELLCVACTKSPHSWLLGFSIFKDDVMVTSGFSFGSYVFHHPWRYSTLKGWGLVDCPASAAQHSHSASRLHTLACWPRAYLAKPH